MSRKLISLIAAIALIVSLGVGTVLANIPGSTFEGGDGNLIVNTAGNTDWTNVANKQSQADLATGQNDNSLGQGSKESNLNVTVVNGSIPNSKADLGRFAVASQTVNSNVFLQLAWTRNNLGGTVDFDFEINQHAQPNMTTLGAKTLVRTAGDLLVLYDFQGGAQKPTISLATWTGSAWSNPVVLPPAVAEAEVNRGGTVSDTAIGGTNASVPAFAFGEANINLTAAGVFPPGQCESFGSIYVKSRSSTAFNAELKDFIAPIPVSINNCATITIVKHTNPGGLDQAFGFTSDIASGTASPDTTPAAFSLNDSAADTETVTGVTPGTYHVTEGANPTGFAFASLSCDASTGSSGAQHAAGSKVADITVIAGGSVTCTYVNDQQLGAIKVTKTSSAAPHAALPGAVFSITKGGVAITGSPFTTGADGTFCVDSLVFGDYAITETAAPAGFDIDDGTAHTVTVDNNTSCASSPFDGETFSATNTPRIGAIKITKTSSAGGAVLAGAQFSVTKGGVAITGSPFTTGADGTVCIGGLDWADYSITETQAPAGFDIDDTTSHTVTVDNNATCATPFVGETFSATDTPRIGAIKITKTSSKGTHPGLAGAKFSITQNGVAITGSPFTTGANGVVCVGGLAWGDYSVTETVAPTGYTIDDTTAHTVTVDNNATCAATPFAGETFGATDTPGADIQVNFRDGGSGATSATITCDNTDGTGSNTAATGWDTSRTVTGLSAPQTIHCTIVVDP